MGGNDEQTELFISALHSSLIGFGVGALFAPEAYQYFPYFAVAYTSVLLAIAKEKEPVATEAGEPALGQLRQKLYGRTREFMPTR
jgi:hypothetical protein